VAKGGTVPTSNSAPLPVRSRDYDLEVEVSATVRVTLSATSESEAICALTREEVWAALGEDNITWEVGDVD